MKKTKKLSKTQIKSLLSLFKLLVSQKSSNKINALRYLDDKAINNISETIYNLLFNENLNLALSKSQKRNLKN